MFERFAGRRISRLAIAVVAPLTLLLAATPALAGNVGGGCGGAASGWVRVSLDGWWEKTLEFGFGGDEEAAIDTLAPLFGVDATLGAVREAVIDGIAGLDANENSHICWMLLPSTPGLPTYIFNGKDDAAAH